MMSAVPAMERLPAMLAMLARLAVTGTVPLMGVAACTRDDMTKVDASVNGGSVDASVNGGTGGFSLDAGATGNGGYAAGAGGSGGSLDIDMPEAGPTRFLAVLDGERVRLTALDPVWLFQCDEPNPRLARRLGDTWTLLRDERAEGFNLHHAAHYLDGEYQSDCALSLGCDVGGCTSLADFEQDVGPLQSRLIAREYVQVGQLEAPSCDQEDAANLDAGDAGRRSVPAIESSAPDGLLAVRFQYFRDSRCQTGAITTDIEVE